MPSTSSSSSSSSSSYIKNWSSSSSSSSSSYIKNWSSSSSSSKSFSSRSSSSSSSSSLFITRQIFLPIINQMHGDILPFSWITESGVSGDGSTLSFTIEASGSPDFNYEAIINRDNSYLTNTPADLTLTVYVPNSDSSKYKHEKSFYVDVIAKDASGIRKLRTHVEPDKYEFEDAETAGEIFNIPKFTWRNT